MDQETNWIQDWPQPPKNAEELELWTIYCALWKDAQLTPSALWVVRWLKEHGSPSRSKGYSFYGQAVERFVYPSEKRKKT